MRNTIKKIQFLLLHAVVILLAWGFRSVFLRSIGNLSYETTKIFFYSFLFISVGYGIAYTIKKWRNYASLFSNITLSFLPVIILTYFNELKYIVVLFCVASVALTLKIFADIKKRPLLSNDIAKVKKIKSNRMKLALYLSRNITALCALLIIAAFFVVTVFLPFSANLTTRVVAANENKTEWTIENKYNELAIFLDEKEWAKASTWEIAKALQILANIEAAHLNLDDTPELRIDNIHNDLVGAFAKKTNIITINTPKQQFAAEIMVAVLHELRHAYQYQLIRQYDELSTQEQQADIYNNIRIYKEEFANYAELAPESYHKLTVEQDSRNYSYERAEEYKIQINELLRKNMD